MTTVCVVLIGIFPTIPVESSLFRSVLLSQLDAMLYYSLLLNVGPHQGTQAHKVSARVLVTCCPFTLAQYEADP